MVGGARIAIATPADKTRLLATIALGFAADPITRWVFSDPASFHASKDDFFEAFGGRAFDAGTAYAAEGGAAVALWMPPGVEPDGERMAAIATAQMPPERMGELEHFFGQLGQFHPHEPHWYLALIAADPIRLGEGLGSALMEAGLARVDESGLPAYLESSNVRNVAFYQRFGFEPIGEIRTATSPIMTPLYRKAR